MTTPLPMNPSVGTYWTGPRNLWRWDGETWELVPEPERLDHISTGELLEELASRMERYQNSTKGRDLGSMCREASENLAESVLNFHPNP